MDIRGIITPFLAVLFVSISPMAHAASCSGGKGDVIFLLDGSSSMGTTNFNLTLKFMQNVVAGLEIASDKTQIGVIEFSTEVAVAFSLNTYSTSQTVKDAIAKVPYSARSTNTHLAIQSMRTEMMSNKGGRKAEGAAQVAVVITDGQSDRPTTTMTQADEAKKEGIIIITVCIGATGSDEMQKIATAPKYVNPVKGFSALPATESPVIADICEAVKGSFTGSAASLQSNAVLFLGALFLGKLMYR